MEIRVHGQRNGGGPDSENYEVAGIGATGLERAERVLEVGRSAFKRKHSKGTFTRKKIKVA